MRRFRIIALALSIVSSFILNINLLSAQEPTINRGIAWLESTQNSEGYWGTEIESQYNSFVDTCEVANMLKYLGATGTTYTNAIIWIDSIEVTNIDYLCQQIEALSNTEIDIISLLGSLTVGINEDGGWNIADGFEISDVKRTALALRSLHAVGYFYSSEIIQKAINFLIDNQNLDGGWGFTKEGGSSIYLTSLVIPVLSQYSSDFYIQPNIDKATSWLISQQNPEGSFGTSIYETALAYSALMQRASGKWSGASEKTLGYILANQLDNGSWDNDAFTTALALRAVKDSAPDLAVSWREINFEPNVPVEGEPVTIKATVWNYGGTPAKDVEVVIGERLSVIGEIGAGGSATVSVRETFTAGSHKIVVTVDPEDKVKERDDFVLTLREFMV